MVSSTRSDWRHHSRLSWRMHPTVAAVSSVHRWILSPMRSCSVRILVRLPVRAVAGAAGGVTVEQIHLSAIAGAPIPDAAAASVRSAACVRVVWRLRTCLHMEWIRSLLQRDDARAPYRVEREEPKEDGPYACERAHEERHVGDRVSCDHRFQAAARRWMR